MQDRTDLSEKEFAEKVNALIITKDTEYQISAATVLSIEDPIGYGDTFRTGLLFGLMNKLDLDTTDCIASLMSAIKIEHKGTQNHHLA